MKITDEGELKSFENPPDEVQFYFCAVRHAYGGWAAGPCGMAKQTVLDALKFWHSAVEARIYTVRLPFHLLGGKDAS